MKPCGTSVLARHHADRRQTLVRGFADRPDKGLLPVRNTRMASDEKRGLVILMSFPDQPFSNEDPVGTWTEIANQEGYAEHGAAGSVSDYFRDQSYGQFRLTFDVLGPVEAAHEYAYYGQNIDWGDLTGWFDQNVGELVEEACRGVADQVHFADYDWDGDGTVEEVYVLYAGHGENDYWSKDTTVIWPHMGMLSVDWEGYENGLELQGVRIDTYACSNEINRSNKLAGLGTICHEFSHCLGLPDLYDSESGTSVLGYYDLMDQGCYAGGSWCPVGYSSYERYACGWLSPTEILDVGEQAQLEALLRPLHEYPDALIYRDSPEAGDYYLIERREKAGWDAYLPKGGLLVWHVDYDEHAWVENTVNSDPDHLRVEHMTVSDIPLAIQSVRMDVHPVAYYDLLGRQVSSPSPHSLCIVRLSNGVTRLVMPKTKKN